MGLDGENYAPGFTQLLSFILKITTIKFIVKKIITLVFVSLSIFCNSQNVSVEKTVFGTQTGFLGIWIHN